MSVEPRLYFKTIGAGARDWRTDEQCFYCHWSGSTGSICLHPTCVIELTIRLYRDVHEIECSSYGYVTERSLAELRERLLREEGRA